ncbi:MAG: J domain-containing protein, partial [Actinobacteria bacterium]|nr:J domain-containing protein [Actinomycetota bacterium]
MAGRSAEPCPRRRRRPAPAGPPDGRLSARRRLVARSYYDVLGVSPTASADTIRRAYRGGARELHPDRRTGASPEDSAAAARAMQELNEAWGVLGDPARRSD